jgi:hypothetical protein
MTPSRTDFFPSVLPSLTASRYRVTDLSRSIVQIFFVQVEASLKPDLVVFGGDFNHSEVIPGLKEAGMREVHYTNVDPRRPSKIDRAFYSSLQVRWRKCVACGLHGGSRRLCDRYRKSRLAFRRRI